jgi:hypothetical protein
VSLGSSDSQRTWRCRKLQDAAHSTPDLSAAVRVCSPVGHHDGDHGAADVVAVAVLFPSLRDYLALAAPGDADLREVAALVLLPRMRFAVCLWRALGVVIMDLAKISGTVVEATFAVWRAAALCLFGLLAVQGLCSTWCRGDGFWVSPFAGHCSLRRWALHCSAAAERGDGIPVWFIRLWE